MIPNDIRRAIVTSLTSAAGPLVGSKLHLFKNDINPTPDTVIGDLEEADFDGYTAGAVATWSSVGVSVADMGYSTTQLYTFACSGSTTPNTIYGAFLGNGTPEALVDAVRFPTPIAVSDVGDLVQAAYRFLYPSEAGELIDQ